MARVLITGGAGFIAHHVIEHFLKTTDWDIVTLDRLDTSGTLSRLEDVLCIGGVPWRERLTFVWHDLKAPLNSLVRSQIGKCDYVLHLAAGSHVDRSIDYPMEFVMDNVVGTCNLLDFVREDLADSMESFIYFGTDEVFGPAPEGVKYVEWARYNSGNPYAASKAGAAELCLAYANTYNLPISITSTMNVFGIRQHPEKYIPLVIRKVLLGETIFIHANKDCTEAGKRHYINTQDVAEAMAFLLDGRLEKGDKYNLVGEKELDNLQLAQIIAAFVGKPLKYKLVDFHSSRPGHDLRYALNGDKMKGMGWEPTKSVEQRLAEVVQWTLANPYWLGL